MLCTLFTDNQGIVPCSLRPAISFLFCLMGGIKLDFINLM